MREKEGGEKNGGWKGWDEMDVKREKEDKQQNSRYREKITHLMWIERPPIEVKKKPPKKGGQPPKGAIVVLVNNWI